MQHCYRLVGRPNPHTDPDPGGRRGRGSGTVQGGRGRRRRGGPIGDGLANKKRLENSFWWLVGRGKTLRGWSRIYAHSSQKGLTFVRKVPVTPPERAPPTHRSPKVTFQRRNQKKGEEEVKKDDARHSKNSRSGARTVFTPTPMASLCCFNSTPPGGTRRRRREKISTSDNTSYRQDKQ